MKVQSCKPRVSQKPDKEVAPIDFGNRPCGRSRRWFVFWDLAKKAPHHTSFSEYSVTHTWQTTKDLSSQPLRGPRDHDPNQFAHPRWSRFVLGKKYVMANGLLKLDASHHALWCRCLEPSHAGTTFEVVTAGSRCQKDYLPRCVFCSQFEPVFYARSSLADLQSGNRYGLFCANGFGRKRYLISTTHDAPLIFGGNSNSHHWPEDNSLRVTTAVCKGTFADWTRPLCISYQFYFVPQTPVCCSRALAISHNYLVSCHTERSQWDLFPMIWKTLKEARPTTVPFEKRT